MSSPSTHCADLPDYVFPTYHPVGGLVHQDFPLICGGRYEANHCYSFINGSWQAAASMADNRTLAAVAPSPFPEDPFSLIIVGGLTNSSIYLFNDAWIENMPDLVKLNNHCVVKINSTTIMVIGGYQNDKLSNKTYILDTTKNIWEEGPSLLHGRSDFGCGKVRSDKNSSEFNIIVAGGWTGKSQKSSEVFDEVIGHWRPGPELPQEVLFASMVEDAEGGVIMVGGERTLGDGTVMRVDTIYHLPHAGLDGAWVELPQKLKTPRSRFVTFMVPDSLTNCN